MTSIEKGEIAQLKIEQRALEKGYLVSRPTILASRYDCIIDTGLSRLRTQIKYGNSTDKDLSGMVKVYFKKTHRNKTSLYTKEEIDLMLVYVPTLDKVLSFGAEIFNNKYSINIRLEPSKNHQKKSTYWYLDYIW
jgi:hypothetical protein